MVADDFNSRVLVWSTAPTASATSASFVIGQTSASNSNSLSSAVSSTTLPSPSDAAILSGQLYISDSAANRVTVMSSIPTTNGAASSFAVGQANLTSSVLAATASGQTSSAPTSVYMDSASNLYIGDNADDRALIFTTAPSSSPGTANYAIGQAALNTTTTATTASGVSSAFATCEGGTQLFMSDPVNNRVLVFNSWNPALGSGQVATYALGQTSLIAGIANQGGTVNASTLYYPTYLFCDSQYLAVSDNKNNRVLIYDLPITQNAPNANLVLGQSDFVSSTANQAGSTPTATSLFSPEGVTSDGTQLFVSDNGNSRVLVWKSWPSENGQTADTLWGQSSFTASLGCNQGLGSPTLYSVCNPLGLSLYLDQILISDTGNRRVLMIPQPQ
jgi:hypothetical protein